MHIRRLHRITLFHGPDDHGKTGALLVQTQESETGIAVRRLFQVGPARRQDRGGDDQVIHRVRQTLVGTRKPVDQFDGHARADAFCPQVGPSTSLSASFASKTLRAY
jgi:hypothetical protein